MTVRNDNVRRITGQSPLSSIVKLYDVFHCVSTWLVCMGIRQTYKQLSEPTPQLCRRLLGRPRSTWLKNITDDLTAFDMRLLETPPYIHSVKCMLISHAGTVVPECFKDDNASQWKSGKFDPRSLKNPRTDRHLNLHG